MADIRSQFGRSFYLPRLENATFRKLGGKLDVESLRSKKCIVLWLVSCGFEGS